MTKSASEESRDRWAGLRARALERVDAGSVDASKLRPSQLEGLVQELEIQQAELEVQNEELRRTQMQLAEARDRYAELYERAPVGYFILDAHGTIQRVNLAATILFGEERDHLLGTRIEKLVTRSDQDACYTRMREAAATQTRRSCELRFRGSDDTTFWGLVEIEGTRDQATGTDAALRVTVLDVTARRRTQEALESLNEKLEQRVTERTAEVQEQATQLRALASQIDRLEQRERLRLSTVLHEHVQQLLVAARMQLDGMRGQDDAAELQEPRKAVDAILAEALDASRGLAGDLSPPVLRETGLIGALHWLAGRMQLTDQFRVDLNLDENAEPADQDLRCMLFGCARELLLNAAKHAGVEEATVALTREAAGIKITVEDKGRGFDPDLLHKRRSVDQTMGLFSIQERISHLGGRMDIDTRAGGGTKVTLRVPAA